MTSEHGAGDMPAQVRSALDRALAGPTSDPDADHEAAVAVREVIDGGRDLPAEVGLRCLALGGAEVLSTVLRHLQLRVHQGGLSGTDITDAADNLIRSSEPTSAPAIVRAVAWVAPNDESARRWMRRQWEEARQKRALAVKRQAACALAYWGCAEEQHWETIYGELRSERPDALVVRVARRSPSERWVEPLRELLHQARERSLLAEVSGAWAEQGAVHDPDDIIAEIERVEDERFVGHILLRGDVLQLIDAPGVVDCLLSQLGRHQRPPSDPRTFYGLLRLNDLWLPRAVDGFLLASDRIENSAREALEELVTANTEDDSDWQTWGMHLKEAACEAAARMSLPELPSWLVETLQDDNHYVAADAADGLGWWEARTAAGALAGVLSTRDEELWLSIAAGRALGCIGGAEAVEALLDNPVRTPSGGILWDMMEFLKDAITDTESVSVALARFWDDEGEDEVLVPAAAGINAWAWRNWGARQKHQDTSAESAAELLRDDICAILLCDTVRDNRAWSFLINALGALGPSAESVSVLRHYLERASEDLRASAIVAAAWSGQDLGCGLLELAGEIDDDKLEWVREDTLTRVVRGLLTHDAAQVDTLDRGQLEHVALRLLRDHRLDEVEQFASQYPEAVTAAIVGEMDREPARSRSDSALIAAAARFAPDRLAEVLRREDCNDWWERSVRAFASGMGRCGALGWDLGDDVRQAAREFLSEALTYPKVRVRDTVAGTLYELDHEAFSDRVGGLIGSDDWRDRAAATEASGLLPQDEFDDMRGRARQDADSRVRQVLFWAEERAREREALEAAIATVQDCPDVPPVFRWKQTLIHAADDWALARVQSMVSDPYTSPPKRTWLKKVREEMEKQWDRRTDKHDRDIKWEE